VPDPIVGPPVTDSTPQTQAQTPVVPAPSASVALAVTRFDGGTGAVLVSNAIPLRPGMLRAEDVRTVHIMVGNTEQPIYVEPLRGRHADGSLRTVLVQWRYNMSGTATVPAALTIGGTRTVPDLPRPTEARGVPAAAALPSSPDYLVATDIVGPTVTAAASAGVPGVARWDAIWRDVSPQHWDWESDQWGANFYDRGNSYYAMWVRTGNPLYWYRGTRIVHGYRTGYIEANNASSPHWAQPAGLGAHYELTGDERSIAALGTIIWTNEWWVRPEHYHANGEMENRMRARMLQTYLVWWQIARTDAERASLAAKLDVLVPATLAAQRADGAYPTPIACGGTLNYMDGMLNDVLIQIHDRYRADPRIVDAVRKSADYLWTQFRPDVGGMQYVSNDCLNVGRRDEIYPVLNNLAVNAFSWSYAKGAGSLYRDRADRLFTEAAQRMHQTNSKEFNQLFNTAYRHLAFRR
jgi:hypothetical protein